jgi:hypothetical protein
MSYVVKWKLIGEAQTRQSPQTYAGPSHAINFACNILKQLPVDIWIEGPGEVRIERDVIYRECHSRGPPCP